MHTYIHLNILIHTHIHTHTIKKKTASKDITNKEKEYLALDERVVFRIHNQHLRFKHKEANTLSEITRET